MSIAPTDNNGLRTASQVMTDNPVTVRRERIRAGIGRLDEADLARLDAVLAFVMGLAD